MTTVDAPNVHNVAVEGTFDDCQDLVKALFADEAFRDELRLGGHELDQLGPGAGPGRLLRAPPRQLRRPLRRRRAHRQLRQRPRRLVRPADGRADRAPRRRRPTATTSSPAGSRPGRSWPSEVVPDAQPEHGHPGVVQPRAAAVRAARPRRRRAPPSCCGGSATLGLGRGAPRDELPRRARSTTTRRSPRSPRVHDAERGYLVDPHTAVGLAAARAPAAAGATGRWCAWPPPTRPSSPTRSSRPPARRPALPERLADLLDRPERYDVLPADLDAVRPHVRAAAGLSRTDGATASNRVQVREGHGQPSLAGGHPRPCVIAPSPARRPAASARSPAPLGAGGRRRPDLGPGRHRPRSTPAS